MATTAFICDMGDSEESVRSLQLKQRGCSYTLLQVLVGVLAVLVLAMTGGIIWMKMSQNCSETYWMLRFTSRENYIETVVTSPTEGKYEIRGNISIKPTNSDCRKSFKLLQTLADGNETTITQQLNNPEVITTVNLKEGSGLRIQLNCRDLKIDEEKSYLKVYQKTGL